MPLLDGLLRLRYVLLAALAALMYVGGAHSLTGENDWHFFTWGSDELFGAHAGFVRASGVIDGSSPGGLHLYASYPFLQIGPPALLLARVLRLGPREGLFVAGAVVQAMGLATVAFLERAFRCSRRDERLALLVGGALLTVVWGFLTHFTHLDDALALTALAAAAWALSRGRWVAAGVLLGLSAASKPWAVVVLALVLAAPAWRARAAAAGAAAATVLLLWGPFVVADRETLRLGDVRLPVSPASALAAMGVTDISRPEAVRLAQFGLGLAVAAAVVAAGRWPLAPLAAFSVRLLAEPSSYAYYSTALVAAALLADLGALRAPVPVLTLVATGGCLLAEQVDRPGVGAWVRLTEYALLLVAVLAVAVTGRTRAAPVRSGL